MDGDKVVKMVDVARQAGVHQTTVSRALRGDPLLPPATRDRIVAIAEEMGYRRNPLVSALFAERRRGRPTGHGAVLAVLGWGKHASDWRGGSGTYSRLHAYLETHAWRLGYRLDEFTLQDPNISPQSLRRILLARGVRGIVLAPMPMDLETVDFDFTDLAGVALRLRLRTPALDRVAPDYSAAMSEAVEKLCQTGHQRLAFISDAAVDERVRHRSLGAYLAAWQFAPDHFIPPWIVNRWELADFAGWMRTSRPDAILTPMHSDYSRVKDWLQQTGWEAPRQLSLVNLDCHAETPDAGIVHNLELEAVSAINLLARKVESADFGVPSYACRLSVPGRWRDGELFAPRAADHATRPFRNA